METMKESKSWNSKSYEAPNRSTSSNRSQTVLPARDQVSKCESMEAILIQATS